MRSVDRVRPACKQSCGDEERKRGTKPVSGGAAPGPAAGGEGDKPCLPPRADLGKHLRRRNPCFLCLYLRVVLLMVLRNGVGPSSGNLALLDYLSSLLFSV